MRQLLFLTALLCTSNLSAQIDLNLRRSFPVVEETDGALSLAWGGGLNAPQPALADLDGDGAKDDLYIFDRGADVHLAFVREENGGWQAAHELVRHFPRHLQHWVVLRDYDADGAPDIFAYSDNFASGVLVYRGMRNEDGTLSYNRLEWEDELPLLYFPLDNGTRTQIYVSSIDYPAIDDLDCDGDLDILTFSIGGGYVQLYANQSVERGYGRDSLIFELADDCYGGIFESGLSTEVDLAPSAGECVLRNVTETGSARHAGSTLLTFDNNGDGIKELVLGDVSFTELVLLDNAGDCGDAWFNAQQLQYPAVRPVDIDFFPAGFYLDLNEDGKRDLVAAPNQIINSADYSVFWYYENTGDDDAPQFVFRDSTYLTGDMIDLGTGAMPAAFDADGDGRLDLVVGNGNRYAGTFQTQSRLRLYRNDGTGEAPRFVLVDDDFLGMSAFNTTTFEFAPTFGDLNGDDRPDALIGGQDGKLFYLENRSPFPDQLDFADAVYPFADIDVGQSARPRIVDLDRDGLNDLVIGTRSGRIHFYRNVGTATAPAFEADPEAGDNRIQLGGIDARVPGFSTGNASPFLVDTGDDWLLFTGTSEGRVEVYDQIENNFNGTFRNLTERLGDLAPGRRSELLLEDFNADGKLELVVGNNRGGLEYFRTDLSIEGIILSDQNPVSDRPALRVYPNPARDRVWVSGMTSDRGQLQLYDLGGRLLLEVPTGGDKQEVSLSGMKAGMYVLVYRNARGVSSRKIIVD